MKALYFVVYAIWYLFSLSPFRLLYIISDIIYFFLYYIIRYRHHIIRSNLTSSFPKKTKKQIITIEKEFYAFLCDYIVETVKLLTINEKELKKRMIFKGLKEIENIINDGQSCAIYLGHYCNWEWITSLPLNIKSNAVCGQIYHPLENKDFDRLFLSIRERMGAISIPMAETLRKLVEFKHKNKNSIIGYISDQVPFWNNIHYWTNFLNHDTPALTGTERIAKSANQAVLYADLSRPKRGYYKCEFKLITRDPKSFNDYELTEIYFRKLEETINRAPQYWLWSHNRWKRSHEEFNIRYNQETGRVDLRDINIIKKEKGL